MRSYLSNHISTMTYGEEARQLARKLYYFLEDAHLHHPSGQPLRGYRAVHEMLGIGGHGNTVKRWIEEYQSTSEDRQPGTSAEWHGHIIDDHVGAHILDLYEVDAAVSLEEVVALVKEDLGVQVSKPTVSSYLLGLPKPWRRKCLTYISTNTDAADVMEHLGLLERAREGSTYFLDEFAFYVGQARTKGRAESGKRPKVRRQPVRLNLKVNVVLILGIDGLVAHEYWRSSEQKGVRAIQVLECVKDLMRDHPGPITVVGDKATIHTCRVVQGDRCWARGSKEWKFTPTAFPQGNPVEYAINSVKGYMRSNAPHSKQEVSDALRDAVARLDRFSCQGYLRRAVEECDDFLLHQEVPDDE